QTQSEFPEPETSRQCAAALAIGFHQSRPPLVKILGHSSPIKSPRRRWVRGNAPPDFTHVHRGANFTEQMPETHFRPHLIYEVRLEKPVLQDLLAHSPSYFPGPGILLEVISKIYHAVRGAMRADEVQPLFHQRQNFSRAGVGHGFSVNHREE